MPDVLLVRARGGDDKDAETLAQRGVAVVEDPYLVVQPCSDTHARERAQHVLASIATDADWLVVTSQASLRALIALTSEDRVRESVAAGRARGIGFATVGAATRLSMESLGATSVVVPEVSTADALRALLAERAPATIIAPQGNQAMKGLAGGLRERGWQVDEQIVYETLTVADRPQTADRLALGDFAAIVLRSPTAVRAVASFVPSLPSSTTIVCGGPTTAAEVERVGLGTVVISRGPTAAAVADTVVECLEPEHSDPGAPKEGS